MMIALGIAGILIAYSLGYLIGFKTGVKSIIGELNKMSKEILDKTKELKKEVKKVNNIIKEYE